MTLAGNAVDVATDVANFDGNLSSSRHHRSGGARDTLDDVDVEDFVYVPTYADLPVPSVDEVGKLYYVRAAESIYTVFPVH